MRNRSRAINCVLCYLRLYCSADICVLFGCVIFSLPSSSLLPRNCVFHCCWRRRWCFDCVNFTTRISFFPRYRDVYFTCALRVCVCLLVAYGIAFLGSQFTHLSQYLSIFQLENLCNDFFIAGIEFLPHV